MSLNRVQVTISDAGGATENNVVNTWSFTTTADTSVIANDVVSALSTFYESLDSYKGNGLDWVTATAKFYSLSDTEPRVPWHVENLGLSSAPTTTMMPREVALCLSFRAVNVSGQNAARRRGRIYFGPINQVANGIDGRPSSTFRAALSNAGSVLLADSAASADWIWNVYSAAAGQAYAVSYGWVDNEWDIQRRRGGKGNVRSTFGTP